ncbi:MAG: sigma-70 family RNA polymerase sigma factor [Desulfuromonadales bacterium]|nr:sigma-70 family RNA polymerase sigma factor [Desulfuromonadales bacterium]
MGTAWDDTADDAALVQACRRGDMQAFECLVRRHQGMLLNVAFRVTGVYEDACEIVQDAFLAAWRKIDSFRGESSLSTWLTAIVINLSRSRRQQLSNRKQHEAYSLDAPLSGGDNDLLPDPPSASPSALHQLEEAELRQALDGCIQALPHEFREALVLRDMRDLPYTEVISALGIREGTLKSRLFRAREAVKDCLKRAVASP